MFVEKQLNSPGSLRRKYSPHVGYIGKHELRVPNYLFSAKDTEIGHPHCRDLVQKLLSRPIEEQYKRSKALTDFLKKREMTFSKLTKAGTYKIFSVPCTNTPLALPKSMFDAIERSSQVLIASLRLVLQDIYGSPNVQSSGFVMSLPSDVRKIFVNAVEKAAHYFPQLHHPVMREYPFFDVVGLDLVLTEDYPEQAHRGPRLVVRGQSELPFKLLEINAGSPSGASNNFHILEGLSKIDPEILQTVGNVMPNDHFKVLGDTYRSLGETWTGRQDGVQIILPPGGQNGATPEIHQLAAYSGMIYTDSGQLYRDCDGLIRLRTISGKDPVVNAIYSRVNSDSALFDLERKLTLRDAETGKPLYLTDPLASSPSGKLKPLRDLSGEKIPLESHYAIPGAIDAIHSRKIFMGGLNRVLDNKIILSTLCYYAPQFFRNELAALGISTDNVIPLSPPVTLPSSAESINVIVKNPDDWVIKSPNLSGGKGVYILKTLSAKEKKKILDKAKANPKDFAYQQLVRIARLPVAAKSGKQDYHYSNLAADLRMWSFYGAGPNNTLPRVTHNGLIRMAPQEKGPLSSIVNTSMGGGYAPLLIVDDIGHPDAVTPQQLTAYRAPTGLGCDLPSFVGAQLIQVAHIVNGVRAPLKRSSAELFQTYLLCLNLRQQCRELLSFIHPRSMESVNEMIEALESRIPRKTISQYFEKRNRGRIKVTTLLKSVETLLPEEFFSKIERIKAFDADALSQQYGVKEQEEDKRIVSELKSLLKEANITSPEVSKLLQALSEMIAPTFPSRKMSPALCQSLLFQLELFMMLVRDHISQINHGKAFAELFSKTETIENPVFDILFAEDTRKSGRFNADKPALIATQEELRTGKLLVESEFISKELRMARRDWIGILEDAMKISPEQQAGFLEQAREQHFIKHPVLNEFQSLINSKECSTPSQILRLLEVMPYARYNLLQYAKQQRLSLQELFVNRLADRKIAFVSAEDRRKNSLSVSSFVGECFARKRQAHGLFSDSQIYLWIAPELNPFIQGYTIGHELVHFQQIRAMMEMEQAALQEGPMAFSQFLNFFGNFLGLASGTIEAVSADVALDRKPVYGFGDLLAFSRGKNWIAEMLHSLRLGKDDWNLKVSEYGSSLAYSTDVSVQIKVKAIREVIPALENAKNIRFAKDLGLRIDQDEIQSALPSANTAQINRYRVEIEKTLYSARLDWESLRIIASHQYPGVRFPRRARQDDGLTLQAPLFAIALGGSYNQTQQ